jgi:hypothetical protein
MPTDLALFRLRQRRGLNNNRRFAPHLITKRHLAKAWNVGIGAAAYQHFKHGAFCHEIDEVLIDCIANTQQSSAPS